MYAKYQACPQFHGWVQLGAVDSHFHGALRARAS
jgi:hypothetical protein